jgi:hypothetical protein
VHRKCANKMCYLLTTLLFKCYENQTGNALYANILMYECVQAKAVNECAKKFMPPTHTKLLLQAAAKKILYLHTHTHTHTHTCTFARAHTHTHIHTYTHVHTHSEM